MSVEPAAGESSPSGAATSGSAFEVLAAFFKLGLTSFGGPVAHLGYFRAELIERRRWLDDNSYSDLVALCQFLPGPASSQVGIALGLARAGRPLSHSSCLPSASPTGRNWHRPARFAD